MIWFTSDTHFNHANIIKYCTRPYADAAEMNRALIENINAAVSEDDTIYHLGDVTFGKDCDAILQLLKGHWHLIPGNHDASATRKSQGWAAVHQPGWKVEEFTLRHKPDETQGKLLHGHMHNPPERRRTKSYALDVGVDAWGYRPVSIDEVRAEWRP